MTEEEADLTAITEQVAEWRTGELEVHLEERAVSNVLLCGGTSKNGYRYSEGALRESAGLYRRKPVFLDHAANLSRPYERSARDLAGWIAEARFVEGRILGEIRLLDTEAGRTLLAMMASETPAVGMSHVILARKSADGGMVESIHDVISVDAVVFPASTGGFREQRDASGEAGGLTEEFERRIEDVQRALKELSAERDEWRRRCGELEGEALRREIEAQLAGSGLPEFAITERLREELRSAPDSQSRSRLIAEQREFVLRCRQRAPCSLPRRSGDDDWDASLTRRIVQAVKGGRT